MTSKTFTTDFGSLTITDPTAIEAMTVGGTRTAGSVAGSLHTYLMSPVGSWGETDQAWGQLVDAVDMAATISPRRRGPSPTRKQARTAAGHLYEAAVAAKWERHPSRKVLPPRGLDITDADGDQVEVEVDDWYEAFAMAGTEDYDRGRVIAVDLAGGRALIAWQSEQQCWITVEAMRGGLIYGPQPGGVEPPWRGQ